MSRVMTLNVWGVLIIAVYGLTPHAAKADATYTYTGSDFLYIGAPYTAGDHVSGTFTVADPLAPNIPYGSIVPEAYTFSDGVQTLDNNNSTITLFSVATDSSGGILYWGISVSPTNSAVTDFILATSAGSDQGYAQGAYTAYGEAVNGTWSGPDVAAPEPGTLFVLGSGLLSFVGLRRGRRIRNRTTA